MLIALDSALDFASEAAREAGAILRSKLGMPGGIRWKDGGPVTEADLAAEERLVDRIRRSFPSHAVLSEEVGAIGEGACRWIIDPLDGTVNFIRGVPWYGVSLAFELDGRVEVAVVYAPSLDLLFTAVHGQGTRMNGAAVRVSKVPVLRGSFIDIGFRHGDWQSEDKLRRVSRLAEAGGELRSLNACSLDLAFIARGWLDAYWDTHVSRWDVAAGMLLVHESGGEVTVQESSTETALLATNGLLHAELSDIVGFG